MQLFNKLKDLGIDPSVDKLLFAFAAVTLVLIQPFFIWGNLLEILRLAHLIGNVIIVYIIAKYYNYNFYNKVIVLFFLIISIYTMVAGTAFLKITYIPLITIFFLTIKPDEQLRIFDHFVTILVVIFAIGLLSYMLSLLGLNIELGTIKAPNIEKAPYHVFFGHAEESDLPVYRFSSIFDEAGVVGTLSGLILSVTGISTRNVKSLIILLTGLISFSLAFYLILIINLLFTLNLKKAVLIISVIFAISFISGTLFNDLISSRLDFKNGRLAGDNRTSIDFDAYVDSFLAEGGRNLIFGMGDGYAATINEVEGVSSYKTVIVNFGIIGTGLILFFYLFSVYTICNSKEGWFLAFIFIISAYQRPDLISLFTIVIFIGGLRYLKHNYDLNVMEV